MSHVIRALQDAASLILWKRAALHFHGGGLETGLAWPESTSWLRALRAKSMHAKAALLETILCAGCWSPARRLNAFGASDSYTHLTCSMCNACLDPDDVHQYWGCPGLSSSQDDDILHTHKYTDCIC